MSVVSNSGPLIHLAKVSLINILKELYNQVLIPLEVKIEAIDKGKEKGFPDAILIEEALNEGWIKVINVKPSKKFSTLAEIAGLHEAEIKVIWLAYKRNITALLDDDAARKFAKSLGIKVRGSLGIILEAVKKGIIAKSKALEALDRLSDIMYLSSEVYRLVRRSIEKTST